MEKVKKNIKDIIKNLEVPFYLGVYALITAYPNRNEGLIIGLLTILFVYFLAGDFLKPVPVQRRHVFVGFLFMCAQVFAMSNVGEPTVLEYIISVFILTLVNSFAAALFDSKFKPAEKLKRFFSKSNKFIVYIVFAVAVILCAFAVFSCSKTVLFTLPAKNGSLFGAESKAMSSNGTFTAFPVNHELTMSFFGLAYLPFAVIAHAVALPLHFIFPQTDYAYFFSFGVVIAQIAMLVICTFLIIDILKTTFAPFISYVISAVFIGSFSTLLSVLTAEKYIFSLLCLLLFIRVSQRKDSSGIPFFAVAACSNAVNFAALPLVLMGKKKKAKSNLMKTGISVLLLLLLSGSLVKPLIPNGIFSLNTPFTERILRFFRFVYGIFLPNSYTAGESALKITDSNTVESVIGGCIFAVAVIGGILLMKKIPLMKISFYWVCVSAVLFAILGLNASHMNLYAVMFGWAYIISLGCCLKAVYEKQKFIGFIATASAAAIIFAYNLTKIMEIISFGIANMPSVQ